jgi:hypothetical protein
MTTSDTTLAATDALPDSISLVWHIDDVRTVRPDLTDAQCRRVLQRVEHEQNADLGVTWDTLRDAAEDLYPE